MFIEIEGQFITISHIIKVSPYVKSVYTSDDTYQYRACAYIHMLNHEADVIVPGALHLKLSKAEAQAKELTQHVAQKINNTKEQECQIIL